jgi:glutathione S-transferase
MLELYQTEWCPASHRVRERLTELGVDYLAHQVPVERGDRAALVEVTGTDTIPALVLDDGRALAGEDAIGAYLEARFDDSPEAEAHRLKAANARRRNLDEHCECSQASDATPAGV